MEDSFRVCLISSVSLLDVNVCICELTDIKSLCVLLNGRQKVKLQRSQLLSYSPCPTFFQLILLNEDADLHHRHHQAKRNQLSLHNCRFSVQYSAIMRVACWSAPDWKHGTASRVRLYGDAVGNIHFYPTLDRTSILEQELSLNNV